MAFIALLGWTALTAVRIASQVYLRGFKLDAEDNLLVRKHVTQVGILTRAADTLIVIMTIAAALMSFDEARASPLWDGRVVVLQVSDATKDNTVELRALLSARSAPAAWDLRCDVREKLIAYLQEEYPDALPRQRQEFVRGHSDHMELSPHSLVSHHRAG